MNNYNHWIPNSDFDHNYQSLGQEIYDFASDIFPITRSITGNGVRDTLAKIKTHLPELNIHEVPTGTKCFDWQIPNEWNVKEAYIANIEGERIIDFKNHNLHLMGYSAPINKIITRDELDTHLYSLPNMPDAIPYVTSYYEKNWGFAVTQEQREKLTDKKYLVYIDSDLSPGNLTYADLIIPGKSDLEIFISTYICHPSLANNEISGPSLATFLARMLYKNRNRFTYRIVFTPETIGSVTYMSKNLEHLQQKTIAGFILTCVGDDRSFYFMPSRNGNTIADRAAKDILKQYAPQFHELDFLKDRASDERQYCSPGADLPVVSIMRTAYGRYPEYHTSKDNMETISAEGFSKSFYLHRKVFELIEKQRYWHASYIGEPQLSRRNLRSYLGGQSLSTNSKLIADILSMSDGRTGNYEIADKTGHPLELINKIGNQLLDLGLLSEI
jgi:aminopeptidase-like protein